MHLQALAVAPKPAGRRNIDRASIKLVIWDLDDTFWHGALAEGAVEVDVRQRERLIDLARRGIVSSICSNNEPRAARKQLQDEGVWAYFVFASLSRTAKSEQVRSLLRRMRLPAENALLVDDSALERQEVAEANPGIWCLSPDEWAELDVRAWGRDDAGLVRLGSYKLLESRSDESTELWDSNVEYLRQSELVATLTRLTTDDAELPDVVELVRRSYQLNFTRTRLKARTELAEYLDGAARSFKVHVRDRYGDHGLCGLVSVSRAGELEHFTFACRVVDMGIEQAVFSWLESTFSGLRVPFHVPPELEASSDWVSLIPPQPLELSRPEPGPIHRPDPPTRTLAGSTPKQKHGLEHTD